MKPRKLFGVALLFPYLLWGICLLIANVFSSRDVPDIWNMLLAPAAYYVIGIIFWFIPYSLLAIGTWIWSKNKSIESLRKSGLRAPVIFSGLIAIEYSIIILVNYLPSETGKVIWASESGDATMQFLAMLITSSLLVGYLLVGIALVIFKVLKSKNLIVENAHL